MSAGNDRGRPAINGTPSKKSVATNLDESIVDPCVNNSARIAAWLGVQVDELADLRRRRHNDRYGGINSTMRRRPGQSQRGGGVVVAGMTASDLKQARDTFTSLARWSA